MALISCPDCGADVSDQAVACPRCARPIKSAEEETPAPVVAKRAGAAWEAWGFGLIAVGVVVAIAGIGALGGVLIVAGFVIFIVGRFN